GRFSDRKNRHKDPERHDPARHLPGDRRPLHGRELRPVRRLREGREGGGLRVRPRRRLQAAHLPLLLPRARRGGLEDHVRGRRRVRPEGGHRGDGPLRHRPCDGARSGAADRRPQHGELLPLEAHRRRHLGHGPRRLAQARPLGDGAGVDPRRRVRHRRGRGQRGALRAGHPHLRDGHPLHARPLRGDRGEEAHGPARDRGPLPRRRPARLGRAALQGLGRRRGGRPDGGEPPRPAGGPLRRGAGAARRGAPGPEGGALSLRGRDGPGGHL
ncbi:MAG: 2-keto-3-deoxy-D-arabino-heptulosonate-7-phosphate synthase I beta, partial [uncultured Rubrobacteraceae bacterium]